MRSLLPFLLCLLTACDPFAFTDLTDNAPVRSYTSSQTDFGEQIAVSSDGTRTRMAVSAAGATEYTVLEPWADDAYSDDAIGDVCKECDASATFATASLAFAGVSPATASSDFCVVTPFSGVEQGATTTGISVACRERIPCGAGRDEARCTFRAPITPSLGTSIVTVFGNNQADAQVLLSDPQNAPFLHRLNDLTVDPMAVSGMTPATGFGQRMASIEVANSTRFVANQGTKVYLFDLSDPVAGTPPTATVAGCVDVGADVFALAWVNDQVAVGSDGSFGVIATSEFTGACPAVPLASTCSDLPTDALVPITCDGVGLALAGADVDGDGSQELVVGAPDSEVDALASAGAVFVVPAAGADTANAVVLYDVEPSLGDRLGAAVAAVPVFPAGGSREEIAAGVPGAKAVQIFQCSGLSGDTGTNNHCLP